MFWFECAHFVSSKLTFVSFLVHILGLYEPVHVADHVLLHLLALLRLLQLTSGHGLLSFLGELSVRKNTTSRKSGRHIQRQTLQTCVVSQKRKQRPTRSTHPIRDWWWKRIQRWREKQSKSMGSQSRWHRSSVQRDGERKKLQVRIFSCQNLSQENVLPALLITD